MSRVTRRVGVVAGVIVVGIVVVGGGVVVGAVRNDAVRRVGAFVRMHNLG